MARVRGRFLAVSIATLLAACSGSTATPSHPTGDRAEETVAGVAAEASALRPPGTPITEDIEVLPGTRLVGTSFPASTYQPEAGPGAWQAILFVDGDPLVVWDRYAELLGLDEWAAAGQACIVRKVEMPRVVTSPTHPNPVTGPSRALDFPVTERLLTDAVLDGENQVECHARSTGVTMSMRYGVEVRCSYAGPDPYAPECDLWRDHHLFVSVAPDAKPGDGSDARYREVGSTHVRMTRGENGQFPPPVPAERIVRPQLVDAGAISALPRPGERLDAGLDGYLSATQAAMVPAGAKSLVPPAMLFDCNSGLVALLRMSSAPEAAVRTFDEAEVADDSIDELDRLTTGRRFGRAWAHAAIISAGGYDLDVTAVADGAGASFVLLTECGD